MPWVGPFPAPSRPDGRQAGQPRYLRTARILLAVFAVLNVVAAAIPLPAGSHAPRSRFDVLFYVTDMALCLIGGLGLATRHRWGWAPAVVAAFVNLGFALLAVARAGPDIAFPGEPLITLVLVVIPAVLLTGVLFSRSSLAWVIGRSSKYEGGSP